MARRVSQRRQSYDAEHPAIGEKQQRRISQLIPITEKKEKQTVSSNVNGNSVLSSLVNIPEREPMNSVQLEAILHGVATGSTSLLLL